MNLLKNEWQDILANEFEKDYYRNLKVFLQEAYQTQPIFPAKQDIFNALHFTDFSEVKVVILGQDPYHGENQAHGLSFSVKPNIPIPPSLQNIYKELHHDVGCPPPNHGFLKKWADQGVLLLNAVLTVQEGRANSHQGKGWELLTDSIISALNDRQDPIVFILWGKYAQKKGCMVNRSTHLILSSPHPSPLSAHRGFWGSKPFSKTNEFLTSIGKSPVDWCLASL